MASNINTLEGFGFPPGLQDILMKQELQLNLFQQENERKNASLQREIEMIKQQLLNLEHQPPPPPLNPTSMPSYSHSLREMGQIGEHESLTKDNINSLATRYPSDPNADDYICGTEACVSDQSKYELLHEEFIALKIDYQVLKFQQNNPNRTITGNAGELTKTLAINLQLEKQIGELKQALQQSRDAKQVLETRNEQLVLLKEDHVNNSENQMSTLETTYAALQTQYNEMSRNNGALERQIRDLKEELKETRGGAEASTMDRTLERSRQEVTRLETALRQREELIQNNEQTIAALKQETQRAQREQLRLEQEKEGILKKNEEKEEMLQSLLDDKQYFSNKLETQERTISELRPLAESSDNVQKRCHQLEIEVSDLELTCQTKCSEYTLVIEQRNKLFNHCDGQNKELSDLRMSLQTYENAIKERDIKLRSAKEKDQEFQTKIDTHTVTHQFLQDELNRRETECQDKQAELQKARGELDKKDKEIGELRKVIEARKNLENPMVHPYMGPYGQPGASPYLPPASASYYNSPES